tara:strand:+ start:122 stop:991 length:870 start_codon:yes stop_codon:yes gene_type:complete
MKVVSLFSGMGGLDAGLVEAGHEVVFANDSDKHACATYAQYLGEHITCCDIDQLDPHDIPNCDMLVGGFPCQGFSKMRDIDHKGVSNPKNEMYQHVMKFIDVLKPKHVLLENVKNIRVSPKFQIILDELVRLGYHVQWKVLNAKHYGVPQNRERLFIIADRMDLPPTNFNLPLPTPLVTLQEALAGLPYDCNEPCAIPNHRATLSKVKFNNWPGNRVMRWEDASYCITASGDMHPHPNGHRRLSVRECARIQTLPDAMCISGPLQSQYRQVGNAVPSKLACLLGRLFIM